MSRLCFSLVAMCTAAAVLSAQPQFKAGVSLVRLHVNVTDNDYRSLAGLTPEDFRVEDKGLRQSVTVEETTDEPLDLVLVAPPVSAVAYITDDQVARFVAGLSAFLGEVQPRDRMGAVLAVPPPRILRLLDSGPAEFGLDAFTVGSHAYGTPLDSIAVALRMFGSSTSERRQAVVAFTNAADFRSVLSVDAAARVAGRLGPALVLVATNVSVDMTVRSSGARGGRTFGNDLEASVFSRLVPKVTEDFARASGGILFNLGEAQPREVVARLFAAMRTGYVLTYEPPKGKGWHPINVTVNRRGARVVARTGYFVD